MTAFLPLVPMIELNPLKWLGGKAKEAMADGFTSMMMGIWSGAMWLLKTAFAFIDSFTPNVLDPGLNHLYSITLWIAGAMALTIALGQIGLAILRQDGRGFATLLAGTVQYGLVLVCWLTVSAGLITGASGLTKGLLDSLLGVQDFSGYAAGDGFVDQVSGTTQAAVLGLTALFVLIPAAFGHMIIMLVRSAALLILVATMPLMAAGALSEGTKAWMWKSVRWFIACVFLEPLLALVLGMGTQFAWAGLPDGGSSSSSVLRNVGISVVGSIIMLVACFMPMVLFRLLAFVDPGTSSGASFRSTMSANGGVAGLLQGHGGAAKGAAGGSGAAAQASGDGRSSSESGAESQHGQRWSAASSTGGGRVGGASAVGVVGKAAGAVARGAGHGMEAAGKVAQLGANMGVDVLGQGGFGQQGYYPTDYEGRGKRPRAMAPAHHDHGTGRDEGVATQLPVPRQQAPLGEGATAAEVPPVPPA